MTKDPSRRNRHLQRLRITLLASVGLFAFALAGVAEDEPAVAEPPGRLEFVGRNLFSKAEGIFHEWRVVESSIHLESLDDAFAVVEVALDSVDTGIDRRDRHLRDPDFFETETYPVATVRAHSPRPIAPDANAVDESPDRDATRRFRVQFDIDLHGVRKTVEGEVRLLSTDPIVFEGDLVIDRTEFGVGSKPSGWNPMAPKAEIPIHFRVEI